MEQIVKFLRELRDHNDRDWFNDHKTNYLQVKELFENLVQDLIIRLQAADQALQGTTVKNSVYRIYRDIRFSEDKSPYKTHMGAYMAAGGRKSGAPGYYIHFDAGQSFFGGGIYQPDPETLKKIRKEIFDFPEDWQAVKTDPDFSKYFAFYEKDKLSRPPRDFPVDFKFIEDLKMRHFIASCDLPDNWLKISNIQEQIASRMKMLVPFNTFLNRALTN